MEARATPRTFWLGPVDADESRGAVDEAASLVSESVTGYGEKYLNPIPNLNLQMNMMNPESVTPNAPSLDLPLSEDDLIEVPLGKQLPMLLDVVLLLGQLSQLGRLCYGSIGGLLRGGFRFGIGGVGDASYGGRGLGSVVAAFPFSRLYTVGGR